MSEIAVKDQEQLNEKIGELEYELEAAKTTGGAATAGATLEFKRKIEVIQAESEAKNKKMEQKLEKLQKQLEDMKL